MDFSERDIKKYFFSKTFTCPICEYTFDSFVLRSKTTIVENTESDFRNIYQDVNALYYTICVCPECLYSNNYSFFTVMKPAKKLLIQKKFDEYKKGYDQFNYLFIREREESLAAFQLAIYCNLIMESSLEHIAGLYLRLAWHYREIEDEDNEYRNLQKAQFYYTLAYSSENIKSNFGTIGIAYLIGDINARLADYKESIKWFTSAINNDEKSKQKKILEKSQDRLYEVKELFKKNKDSLSFKLDPHELFEYEKDILPLRVLKHVFPHHVNSAPKKVEKVSKPQKITFKKGQDIFFKNDLSECCYQIIKGSIKISIYNNFGKELIFTTIKTGSYFGEYGILNIDSKKRTASAYANEDDTILQEIPGETFLNQLKNYEFGLKIVKSNINRILNSLEIFKLNITFPNIQPRYAIENQHYKTGEYIFTETSIGKNAFLLIKGKIELTKFNKNKSEITLDTVEAGGLFGETCLLFENKYYFNAKVVEDCQILDVTTTFLERMHKVNHDFLIKIIRILGQKLVRINEFIKDNF